MVDLDLTQHPHRRWNPLLESFVLCSPHRTKRPWNGAEESANISKLPEYLPDCYLCPSNVRATGAKNDSYVSTYAFENDYAALVPNKVEQKEEESDHIAAQLFRSEPVRGRCFVLCFHPRHDLTLAQMTTPPLSARKNIVPIIEAWRHLYEWITRENPFVRYIQFFENKGSAMGCSNPHPHGQVWSMDYIPDEPLQEMKSLRKFATDASNSSAKGPRDHHDRPCLLLEYAMMELCAPGRPRVVTKNDDFVALVPYWAVWPFEIVLLPYRRFIPSVAELASNETVSLAEILGEVACRFDNLFKTSFPYSMGIHQRPTPVSTCDHHLDDSDYALLHLHFYPPLLRSATVRKFLVGFEMMAEPQRDITAEAAAARLRDCATTHYMAD
ncbi:UDP-glucose--hexose-1-phosphate uridylyltransferase [Malassezia yamatoensis]|uniref:Galactose-1-phosphate uridylyltransferase n=1 Tax=Malassezia yamatoensis TaxID=253288 RepID=A0AAJ6CFN5_9BASI|nr:UDP-glucose--hexose-1-phosphate uridylyltransferase [Malassezia yamatoensis]